MDLLLRTLVKKNCTNIFLQFIINVVVRIKYIFQNSWAIFGNSQLTEKKKLSATTGSRVASTESYFDSHTTNYCFRQPVILDITLSFQILLPPPTSLQTSLKETPRALVEPPLQTVSTQHGQQIRLCPR